MRTIEAHENEVVSIDYSPYPMPDGGYLLASGSRDRLIHVYDQTYSEPTIKEDHSSSIVSVRFAFDEREKKGGTKLVSCGADKVIVVRHVAGSRHAISTQHKEALKSGKLVSMDT